MIGSAVLGGNINGATAFVVFGVWVGSGGDEYLHGGKVAVTSSPMQRRIAISFVQVVASADGEKKLHSFCMSPRSSAKESSFAD